MYKCHEFGRESGLLLHSMPGSHSPFSDFVWHLSSQTWKFFLLKSTNSINSTQQCNFVLNPHVNESLPRWPPACYLQLNWWITIYYFVPATPAANLVDVPKEPEFVIFASYSHPPNMPMRHSVLKEMVSTWRSAA